MEPTCSQCHVAVRATDFFCFNCGKNLHPAPPPTSAEAQAALYLKSFFLPPMGIIWGLRYMRQGDTKSVIVGSVAILITLVELVVVYQTTVNLMSAINAQIGQVQNLQGL